MPWPQAQDYNEAIQNPRTCFTDGDLKLGSVKTSALGIPVAISGAFASVYQVTTPQGRWALRCFVREVSDTRKRYEEISKSLKSLRLPYTTEFEFQPNGIRVAGRLYPIVKMQWMTGELLGDYVAKNINNPQRLAQLAEKWAAMVTDLNSRGIAHGDLQHGNVLVVNHELKLIDYDGMYVPAFKGLRSNEQGHPNYQHPKRDESEFGPHIDNFSAWIIYGSLRILAASPGLYSLTRSLGRDECLLFNREDFANASTSPIFNQLQLEQDDTVKKLSQHLSGLVRLPAHSIPALDPTPFAGEIVTTQIVTTASDWWKEQITDSGSKKQTVEPRATHVSQTVSLGPQPKAQRDMLEFIAISALAFAGGYLGGALGLVGYLIVELGLLLLARFRLIERYRACPEVAARDRHAQEMYSKSEDLEQKKQRKDEQAKIIHDLELNIKQLAAQLQEQMAGASGIQGATIKEIYREQAIRRADWEKRQRALTAEIDAALQRAIGQMTTDTNNIQNQINRLASTKAQTVKTALETLRKATLHNLLSRHKVEYEHFSGIGSRFKLNLKYAGIITAADVTYGRVRNVDGFGTTRTHTMTAWRERLEASYDGQLPSALPAPALKQIESDLNSKRTALENQLRARQQNAMRAKIQVERSFDVRRQQLSVEENQINQSAQTKLQAANLHHTVRIAALQGNHLQSHRNATREITSTRLASNSLEAEIHRLQAWQRNIGIPKMKDYENLTYEKFVHEVFFRKLNS